MIFWKKNVEKERLSIEENEELISKFLFSKRVESCSQRTLIYHKTTIEKND
ncbi:MAG: hypothetical protein LBU40_02655 [Methanobrevibacter sp.]|jgi:hypothetical protein|nr:hypothetical protein [Methanobrevibacter sp.]